MTTLLDNDTKEDVSVTDDGDHDKFSHYVKKTDLDKAYLEGKHIMALCGKKWLPQGDFSKYPVCPSCKEIYEKIKN